jgi:Nucleotidyl transferase AbiEii toxin, Type IV TA system
VAASLLTPLQDEVLKAFFEHETRFFLSGGGALAGFHLAHRRTHDLDLFTLTDALDDGERTLAAIAPRMGATFELLQTSPDFRRGMLRRGEDAVVIDLVRDRSVQGTVAKLSVGAIRVDPPQEILANKLCTLLSRSELRDLVDVYALTRAGFRIEDALPLAQQKDGGLSPAQLGWVLSQINLEDLPAGRIILDENDATEAMPTRADLQAFLKELIQRLVRMTRTPPA